mgnify:CR=1 FL=1
MASSYISRLAIGSIIIAVVLFFFLTNFDLLFIFLLLALISYEFLYLKIINKFILFFFILLTTISILFVPYKLFENIFILQLISLFCIFLFGRYKKELFVISIYFFSIILFYLISTDRNFFYLLFLISFLNDTIAYISGKSLRGPLIIPKISPNKTLEGYIGGIVCSSISFISPKDVVVAGPRTSLPDRKQLSGQLEKVIKKQKVSELVSKYSAPQLPDLHSTCAIRW